MKTHYDILGLLPTADDVVVKAAFKALAQKFHTDKNKNDATLATQWMTELNAAYAILGNKTKRKTYDAWLQSQAKAKARTKVATSTKQTQAPHNDYQDLIAQLKKNALDEIMVVELYEKLFACKVKIVHGWVNSYAIQAGKKALHLDFIKLKSRIIDHLEQL